MVINSGVENFWCKEKRKCIDECIVLKVWSSGRADRGMAYTVSVRFSQENGSHSIYSGLDLGITVLLEIVE